jgi:GWxTD domain-containing protein
MKNILITLLVIGIYFTSFTQVEAVFNLKRFNSPTQPYIENYLKIYASSIEFRKDTFDKIQYNIQVTQILRQDTSILDYKKYIIQNIDTSKSNILEDLIDQRRFYVKNGETYTMEVIIEDLLTSAMTPKIFTKKVQLNYSPNKIQFSDIELIEQYSKTSIETSISKSGYNILPMAEDFLGTDFKKVAYYAELYNTEKRLDTNGKYILRQFIENYDTKKQVGQFNKIKRYSTSNIQPILNIWDIELLPTGNYNIVIQVINKEKETIAEQRQRFQRLNLSQSVQIKNLNQQKYINTFADKINSDSLNENILCLAPIASELERSTIENQLNALNDKMKREFIYQFWFNQNQNDPEKNWNEYKRKLKYVQRQYGARSTRGYNTDRGRIYLKYGMPNSINDKPNSSNSYPYQVWHYYRAGKFNNKTCIFYSPNMIGNEYMLLHSDIPGENKDENWQRTLKKRASGAMDEELRHQSWEQY